MSDLRLARDPEPPSELSREVAAVLREVEVLGARLEALAARLRARPETPKPDGHAPGDRLLTAEQAAGRLGLRPSQVYRRAKGWPFTRRLGRKTVRFSEAGLDAYLEGLQRP